MKNFFKAGVPAHCYQKGFNGNVLFYSQIDRLVYYTIYSVEARKRGIRTLALCLMTDHTHSLLMADNSAQLSLFNRNVETKYALAFKNLSRKSGVLFMPYGHAFKFREKDIRSCIIYIANNPVEKHKYAFAEQDRWTFLSYADNRTPFSDPLIVRRASAPMKKAISMIHGANNRCAPLSHQLLKNLRSLLNKAEWDQLVDLIISLYMPIDFPATIRYFGTADKLLTAIHSTTGSEHDITEERDSSSETVFLQMSRKVQSAGYSLYNKDFLSLDGNDYRHLVRLLLSVPGANASYLGRFLHRPINTRHFTEGELNDSDIWK